MEKLILVICLIIPTISLAGEEQNDIIEKRTKCTTCVPYPIGCTKCPFPPKNLKEKKERLYDFGK